jgi:hypothetical protein
MRAQANKRPRNQNALEPKEPENSAIWSQFIVVISLHRTQNSSKSHSFCRSWQHDRWFFKRAMSVHCAYKKSSSLTKIGMKMLLTELGGIIVQMLLTELGGIIVQMLFTESGKSAHMHDYYLWTKMLLTKTGQIFK